MPDVDPDLLPAVWDSALVGTTITPGLCVITAGGRDLKWDAKAGAGKKGASTKLTGIEPGKFTMTITFFDGVNGQSAVDQRLQWETQILPQLKEAESGKTAIAFYHPAVSEPPCDIRAAVPVHVGHYEQDSNGVWKVAVDWLEFKKPATASGSPTKAKTKDPVPQDENEKKIAEMTKELKALAES